MKPAPRPSIAREGDDTFVREWEDTGDILRSSAAVWELEVEWFILGILVTRPGIVGEDFTQIIIFRITNEIFLYCIIHEYFLQANTMFSNNWFPFQIQIQLDLQLDLVLSVTSPPAIC